MHTIHEMRDKCILNAEKSVISKDYLFIENICFIKIK